jgi:hypothetical protein
MGGFIRTSLDRTPHLGQPIVKLLHDMEAVGDQLGVRQLGPHRLVVGLPHIDGDR